jgi:hypothetical protein
MLAAPLAQGDEILTNLRDDVRTEQPDSPHSSRDRDQDRDRRDGKGDSFWDSDDQTCEECDEDGTSGGDNALWGLAGLAVTSPFWAPAAMIGDTYDDPGYFAHYPYQYDCGYMLIDPVEAVGLDGPYEPYSLAARFRGEVGTAFDDLDWIGGRVQVDTRWRLGLESDFRLVREDSDAGRDDLWLGDANLLYRFAQSGHWQFRAGLGASFLSDRIGSDFGLNFTYMADWQPVRPLVFAAELDLGWLGEASLVHVRTTGGVTIGVSELFVGYDLYDIGSTQIQGLVAGIQVWY